MVCIFYEGRQYLSSFEDSLGCQTERREEMTPYGKQSVYVFEGKNIICIIEAGHEAGIEDRMVPKSVAYVLEKYNVDGMLMISKVGGINPLLEVGDILVMSDYIDRTSIYDFSYVSDRMELIPRYDMQEPFSPQWAAKCYQRIRNSHLYLGRNVFGNGVYACTNGPGFESKSEIAAYNKMGCDVVGHYLSPYMYYCRELGIAYLTVSIVSNTYASDKLLVDTDETKRIMTGLAEDALEAFDVSYKEEQKKHWIRNLK